MGGGGYGRGQKIGVFRFSFDRMAMRHCRQLEHLALDTHAKMDNAQTQ